MRQRADTVAQRLSAAFGLGKPLVTVQRCAQQENAYDCGVYVIAFAHAIATAITAAEVPWDTRVTAITPRDAKAWRERLRTAIDELSRAEPVHAGEGGSG